MLIESICSYGLDALGNHFEVVIPPNLKLTKTADAINARLLTIDIPDRTLATYEIVKKGKHMQRVSGDSNQEKSVTFTFRADRYYACYKSLLDWMDYIQDANTLAMTATDSFNEVTNYRMDITVKAMSNLSDSATSVATWTLKGAQPLSVGGISFDTSSGDPLEISVEVDCLEIVYPNKDKAE